MSSHATADFLKNMRRYKVELLKETKRPMREIGKDGVEFLERIWTRHSSRRGNVQSMPGNYCYAVASLPKEFMRQPIPRIIDELAALLFDQRWSLAVETEAMIFADAKPRTPIGELVFILGSSMGWDAKYMALVPATDTGHPLQDYFEVGGLSEQHRVLLIQHRGGGESKYPIG